MRACRPSWKSWSLRRATPKRRAVVHINADGGIAVIGNDLTREPEPQPDRLSGDWFGAAVNLASRISALAAGGGVLISEATRDAAGDLEGLPLRDHGLHRLRNIARPVHLFAAVSLDACRADVSIDPVCRMAVDPDRCAGTLVHEGVEYDFCSLDCAGRFAASPELYLTDE